MGRFGPNVDGLRLSSDGVAPSRASPDNERNSAEGTRAMRARTRAPVARLRLPPDDRWWFNLQVCWQRQPVVRHQFLALECSRTRVLLALTK